MKVKSESEVTQSCLTPSDPTDCSPPGSSVHGICQATVLEWDAIAFSEQLLYNSAIPFLGNVCKKIKNMHPHKNFYVNIHGSIIHNSQKVETTQMSTN